MLYSCICTIFSIQFDDAQWITTLATYRQDMPNSSSAIKELDIQNINHTIGKVLPQSKLLAEFHSLTLWHHGM